MLSAFDTAQSECKTIQSGVDSARAQLAAAWMGDASSRYGNSMNQWMEGFAKVQASLNQINDAMGYYRQMTTTVESNNSGTSSGWAVH
jgi:WXG100 family type VII secretion target